MKTKIYTAFTICFALLLLGCSTKKNTSSRRFYHGFTTKFNVFFNGNESFKKGYNKLESSYKPDYSHIIDMFAVSSPSTKGLAKSEMAITTEKCQKAIKEHSIKKKPKKNMNKLHDPKYMEFYNQEEFNPMIYKVWLLLGKSQFYANDYLAASATFTYIAKHFPEKKDAVNEAMVWKAMSLKEMDWTYEAESLLDNMPEDEFNDHINCIYSEAYADLKIKLNEYEKALPYLDRSIQLEKNKKLRTRLIFIQGQIYQQLGQKNKAYELYDRVIKSNPDYQMSFNARIRQTEVFDGQDSEKLVNSLLKMSKKSNNKDYLDQIFYAIGNVYLNKKDTTTAISYYNKSIESSTRNGLDKVLSLVTLGDLYYNNTLYIKAQPCFSEASQLIDQSYPDYSRITKLAQILGELSQLNDIVVVQDSLLALGKLPKSEQLAAANREIEKIKKEEEAERERQKKEYEANKRLDIEIENMAVMNKQAMGGKQTADWYFYNNATVQKGKLEFQRKFGIRRLEDNWNRKNKSMISIDEFADNVESVTTADSTIESMKDSENKGNSKALDNKNPEYYLRQIPSSPEQINASNAQIADALFNMAVLYNERLEDANKAIETFLEFIRRFPDDKRAADAYFYCYRISEKNKANDKADFYKNELITQYPTTKYAMILSQSDFREKLEKMQNTQDSIYESTYRAYLNSKYDDVIKSSNMMLQNYPVSDLIPKFILLKALSEGKLGNKDSLQSDLETILEKYPQSNVVTMAKDIIALIKQGGIPQEGSSSNLSNKRELTLTDSLSNGEPALKGFRLVEKTPYLFYIITNPEEVKKNMLLYYTASYNFTKFLVKDFELNIKDGTLVVSGLDNLEEALMYDSGIQKDEDIQNLLKGKSYRTLVISQENSELIGRGFSIEQYEQFYQDSILNRKKSKAETKIELVGDASQVDSLASASSKLNVKEGDDLMKSKTVVTPSEDTKDTNSKDDSNEQTKKENKVSEQEEKALKTESSIDKPKQDEKPKVKKDLKKYKGLYTYDVDADHKMVLLITKEGVDVSKVIEALNNYNKEKQPLLNLKVSEGTCNGFSKTIEVGLMPGARIAKSYLLQLVKDDSIRDLLNDLPHRRILISDDNLATLKTSGNFNVYMELFRRLYLGR